jgi:hypothetical protein
LVEKKLNIRRQAPLGATYFLYKKMYHTCGVSIFYGAMCFCQYVAPAEKENFKGKKVFGNEIKSKRK